uniref:Uncharacterized protein n=1 Tax=Arundo donax TaxID=35708 RepID=A0A0A9A140_ARUDO
MQALLQLVKS